jgi:DNA ligase-1
MLLAELVATARCVADTASRNGKIVALAELLRRLPPDEIGIAVCLLSGLPRQGKIGLGWASVAAISQLAADDPSVTIAGLDVMLSQIQRTTGPGSAAQRARILTDLFARATAEEADFVRRLLVGELRQGALAGLMSEAIARAFGARPSDVRRALMLSGDLGRTATAASERRLDAIGLTVLHPVLPMLASTAEDLDEALTGPASVEWKLDGVRVHVHRSGDDVRVFTRNLNDVTSRVPEIVAIARSLGADSFVLDGEAIAMAPDERPHAFQDVMSRFGRQDGGSQVEMVPYFFDALHVDGEDLIDRPLRERVDVLARVAGAWRMPAIVTADADAAREALDAALAAGHEGVMVKDLDSVYQAGRRGKTWRKVKPVRTFDLVVLGAEWGHGRRRGWLSNLHLGALGADGCFVMVGKTFKGLTDELLRWQTARFLELKTAQRGITVFVRPEVVVEIELDGVQSSTRYPGGIALRFPRVKRYRPDKDPSEADTIDALRALLRQPP